MKRCSAGQPCDITGIESYRMIDENGGIQWPWRAAEQKSPEQQRRLFTDGKFFHADGKARFYFEEPRAAAELPDKEFPFVLLTGRGSAAQWHTQTRTGKSAVLRSLYPERGYVEINPEDARELKISDGTEVTVRSRRGRLTARAFVTSIVQEGHVFIPMHYATANQLTFPEFDPYSRQPSYKMAAVAIEHG
jgi:assimilatory nitrate reductase catalytic subunit